MNTSYSRKFTPKTTLLLAATIVVGLTLGIHLSILERLKPYVKPYSATPESTEQGRTMNEVIATNQNTERAIKEAFGTKYSRPPEEVMLTISKSNSSFAKGTVRFAGEVGGGWFLAANTDSGWTVVADGDGNVMCSEIEPYNFPADYVSECYDEETSATVLR